MHDPFTNREVSIFDQVTHVQFQEHTTDQTNFYEKVDAEGVPITLKVEDKDIQLLRGEKELESFIYDHVIAPKFNTQAELINELFDIITPAGLITINYGEAFMQDNVTETVIAAANTPVKVLGTTTSGFINNFEHTSNRLTYKGKETRIFDFIAAISASRVGGGSEDYTFYLAINGIVQNKTHQRRNLTADGGSITVTGLLELNTDDYVEVWAENNGGTANALIEDMNYNTLLA